MERDVNSISFHSIFILLACKPLSDITVIVQSFYAGKDFKNFLLTLDIWLRKTRSCVNILVPKYELASSVSYGISFGALMKSMIPS